MRSGSQKIGAIIWLLVALANVSPGQCQSLRDAQIGPNAPIDSYSELAQLLVAEERTLSDADPFAHDVVSSMVASDSGMKDMVARYPGLDTAMVLAISPIIKHAKTLTIPQYRADLAEFYRTRLSASDAAAAAAFFKSSEGQRLLDDVVARDSFQTITAAVYSQRNVTSEDLDADLERDAPTVWSQLADSTKSAFLKFYYSKSGQNLNALQGEKTQIDLKWINYVPPESEKQMMEAVLAAMTGHIAKTDPAVAKRMAKILGLAPPR